jgi:hypothetical protein
LQKTVFAAMGVLLTKTATRLDQDESMRSMMLQMKR